MPKVSLDTAAHPEFPMQFITLMQVAAPWNIVGLVIASVIGVIVLLVVGGLLNVLVYRPARKPALAQLPELPALLEHEESVEAQAEKGPKQLEAVETAP